MKAYLPSTWQLVAVLALASAFSCCRAFVLPNSGDGGSAGAGSSDDVPANRLRLIGTSASLPEGSASVQGIAGAPVSGSGPESGIEDWEEMRRMLLEYLDQGGDPWEIPEVPRLILISELGLQQQPASAPARTDGYYAEAEGSGRKYSPVEHEDPQEQKKKRDSDAGPSLSVVNHLDVLRQKLLLEMARRRMQKSQSQIIANQNLLRQIGKRSVAAFAPKQRAHFTPNAH